MCFGEMQLLQSQRLQGPSQDRDATRAWRAQPNSIDCVLEHVLKQLWNIAAIIGVRSYHPPSLVRAAEALIVPT